MSDYRTDRDGFPIETCGRCGGNGRYPSSAWNGVCLGCSGSGSSYPKGKVAELAVTWANELHTMGHVVPAVHVTWDENWTRGQWPGVAAGEQIRLHDEPWRTVAAVRATARMVGQTYIGIDERQTLRAVTLLTHVTFTDGTSVETCGEQWRRRIDQDAAEARRVELVAQAVKAYERLLKSRVTRQATATAKAQAARAALAERTATLLATHPELVTLVDMTDAKGFLGDMRARIMGGNPTEAQVTAAVNAVRRDAERKQAQADLVAAGVTCPTGRLTVDAEVVWVDARDTDWGVRYLMRIRTDEGWNALGNVPRDLLRFAPPELQHNLSDPPPLTDPVDWLKGRRVRVKATFAPSDKYQLSGDFKRPTVEVLDPIKA